MIRVAVTVGIAALLLFGAAWWGLSSAANSAGQPVEENTNYQRPALEKGGAPETSGKAGESKKAGAGGEQHTARAPRLRYLARYEYCRSALGVKPAPHKGTYRDARACRLTWQRRARKDTVLAIRWVWPRGQWANAEHVTACEGGPSRRIDAVGDNGASVSAFQVNGRYWRYDRERMLTDAVYAAQVALGVWYRQGWGGWTCARRLGIR